jgi:ABC-type branched-subunit amino acid transport system substrate-binding protein
MGAEIARDWINARGGIGGRKVELVIEDSED